MHRENPENEVTMVVNRHIKPGREREYNMWFRRLLNTIKKFPGYRGTNVIMPKGTDPDARIIVYHFENKEAMENWHNSPDRKKLIAEVQKYSEQAYTNATGLETWFKLPDTRSVIAPPRWKMVMVTFIAAAITSFVSHIILSSYLDGWALPLTTIIYSAILVLTLTYIAMPNLTKLFKRWLYSTPEY